MFILLRGKPLILCLIFVITVSVSAIFMKNYHPVNSKASNIIVVDAGHGGIDGGALGLYNIVEKDLNLEIAKKVEEKLKAKGFSVIMTRSEDVSIHSDDKNTIREKKTSDLLNRAELANKSGARLFISIHLNTFLEESISGAQVFHKNGDQTGKEYAKKIMDALKALDEKNKRLEKVIPNPNLLFKKLEIPAVLIECGFISNNSDAVLLKSYEYQNKLAEKIVDAIYQ